MNKLNQSNYRKFLNRFYSFNDAVLRTIELSYGSNGKRSVSATMATRDTSETKNDGWVCVRLAISDASDFRFSDTEKSSAQVLSHGVHICWFDRKVAVDFSNFIDEPGDQSEFLTSSFFAIGSDIEWIVEPY